MKAAFELSRSFPEGQHAVCMELLGTDAEGKSSYAPKDGRRIGFAESPDDEAQLRSQGWLHV